MLIKSKTIRNYKLKGIDGEVGSVKEFYFDDKHWTVRYLIANTGGWLNSRQVLISPYFLKNVDHDSELINVDLTKNQIENSPTLDQDRPVSKQYEESYHAYYGTPLYWDGPNMWGANPYILRDRAQWSSTGTENPGSAGDEISANTAGETSGTGMDAGMGSGMGAGMGAAIGSGMNTGISGSINPTNNVSINPSDSGNESSKGNTIAGDRHLRSSEDVSGHKIYTSNDDKIGSIDDFIIDDETWAIRYLIINTGNLFTGKKVLLSPQWIEKISWEDSKVYVNMTKDELKESPEYSDESGLTRDYESSLFGYYKKTPYWSPEPATHDYTHSQVDTEGKYSGY